MQSNVTRGWYAAYITDEEVVADEPICWTTKLGWPLIARVKDVNAI